jgi:hypothetical protein
VTKGQCYLCSSLAGTGWPAELLLQLLNRCGATEDDLRALVAAGVAELRQGRYRLTPAGRRLLKRLKQRRDF